MRKQELEGACGEMGAVPSARGAGVPAFQKEGNSEQCLPCARLGCVSLSKGKIRKVCSSETPGAFMAL